MSNIRQATKSDAGILARIHQECFTTGWNTEVFNDLFAIDNTLALLAGDPHPAGMMVYRIQPEEAEIITLAVTPAFRRQGLGRAMLEKAMETAVSMGARHMFLDVEDGNAAALGLYESHGFSLLRRRRDYYRRPDATFTDALVMRCKLA